MGDVVRERDGRFLVVRLHVLHLRRSVEETVLLGGDGHVHLRQPLGVRHILIHFSFLYVECLQCIQRSIGLFRSRIFLYRLAVSGNSISVLTEVPIEHRAL